jgi:hypothetical protein
MLAFPAGQEAIPQKYKMCGAGDEKLYEFHQII